MAGTRRASASWCADRFIGFRNSSLSISPGCVEILFFGKVFSIRKDAGKAMALRLWEKFVSIFPLEDPFNYPLEPIATEAEFMRFYDPLDAANPPLYCTTTCGFAPWRP